MMTRSIPKIAFIASKSSRNSSKYSRWSILSAQEPGSDSVHLTIRRGCGFFHLKYVGKPPPPAPTMPAWRMISTASSLLSAFTSSRLRCTNSAKILSLRTLSYSRYLLLQALSNYYSQYNLCAFMLLVLVHSLRTMKLSRRTANILLAIGVYMLLTWGTRVFTFLAEFRAGTLVAPA